MRLQAVHRSCSWCAFHQWPFYIWHCPMRNYQTTIFKLINCLFLLLLLLPWFLNRKHTIYNDNPFFHRFFEQWQIYWNSPITQWPFTFTVCSVRTSVVHCSGRYSGLGLAHQFANEMRCFYRACSQVRAPARWCTRDDLAMCPYIPIIAIPLNFSFLFGKTAVNHIFSFLSSNWKWDLWWRQKNCQNPIWFSTQQHPVCVH